MQELLPRMPEVTRSPGSARYSIDRSTVELNYGEMAERLKALPC